MIEQRKKVIEEAKRWIGTPFHMNASIFGKNGGTDCGRFLTSVYRSAGLTVPENLAHWPVDWSHHSMSSSEPYLAIIKGFATETTYPQPADFCLTRMGRAFSHSAILIEWPTVIHCVENYGVIFGDITKLPFERRPIKFFTFWK